MNKAALGFLAGIFGALLAGSVVAGLGSAGSTLAYGVPVFALCAVVAYLIQWVAFVPAFLLRTEHYFDLVGSLTYLSLVALGLLLSGDPDLRTVLIGMFIAIWAARLGSFLFFRVREAGSDRRFRVMKHNFTQFLMTWTLQGSWVFITLSAGLAAITGVERAPMGWLAWLGAALWLFGFAVEVVADRQKRAFRADPANEDAFIHQGLWAWSRHPNYFGEILLWVGILLMAAPVLSGWQWIVLVSPLYVWLLLTRISGIPMLERRAERRWGEDPAYQNYKRVTPVLVPQPPGAR